jgi:hypothetical protein
MQKSIHEIRDFAFPCEYIFIWMNFVVSNKERFQTNSPIRSVNTRHREHLHRQIGNFSCFQKSAYNAGIKTFNSLPSNLRRPVNRKSQFKVALKRYLNTHSFYSVEEFLMLKNESYVFFSLCTVVWTLYNMCVLYVKLFLCYHHNILKKYLSIVSLFCVFVTYSTSYCCYYKLMDPWNVCARACVLFDILLCSY